MYISDKQYAAWVEDIKAHNANPQNAGTLDAVEFLRSKNHMLNLDDHQLRWAEIGLQSRLDEKVPA